LIEDWLLAAYAAEGYPGVHGAAVRAQAMLYAEYTHRRMVRAAPHKLFALAAAVICDYRGCALGAEPRGCAWYASRVGFAPQNIGTWLKARATMLGVLDQWDRRGLAAVAAVLVREERVTGDE
ncbi:MAG: hypothetical protein L0H63_11725, partial [Nitrococcus sp.]|nr:hypothetical protein [Nitrococcus sp.]